MRQGSQPNRFGTSRSWTHLRQGRPTHPTLSRALDAHRGDCTVQSARLEPSANFLDEMRRAGVDRAEVQGALTNGERTRQWDGCVLVRDRFLGVELELDPTGKIGIRARRFH